ncbi:MAG: 7-carboxy-7-deazaguanine synthase QueE [Bacteroidales bacterium]|nr:7-carboxy-7-deazaguanine synthase QueE [Bacteroidales bacterium]
MSEDTTDELLLSGKTLPLMEEFYTIQGEGFNTGQAAYFVRIGGCDVGCHWCDVKESWNAKLFPATPTDSIVANVAKCPAKAVVVTGGEPLMYNLNYFCSELKKEGINRFLETSGSHPLSGEWEWICLSPKKNAPPLNPIYSKVSELKVIIANKGDFDWAEKNAKLVNDSCHLYLQPEWSKSKLLMPIITDYIMAHPRWKISLQSHKYMNIP